MKTETKEVNTINENFQKAKNAYDDFEKSQNGQLVKTYEKNEADLKKVKDDLEKNLKVKEKMKNIKEIIDKYNKAVKRQGDNSHNYTQNAIARDLSYAAGRLYENQDSFQRKGHENSPEFNRIPCEKNEQHRLFPTAQRRFRLEYAEWLKEFATLAQEELQREVISKDASSKQDLSKETAETKANGIVENTIEPEGSGVAGTLFFFVTNTENSCIYKYQDK